MAKYTKETQVILTIDLASYLLEQGFTIKALDKNRRNTDMPTFVFDNSRELQDAMDTYFALHKLKACN